MTNNNFRFAAELIKLGHRVDLVGTKIPKSTIEAAPSGIRLVSLKSSSSIGSIRPLVSYFKECAPDYLLPSGAPLHLVSAIAKIVCDAPVKVYTRTHTDTSEYLAERGYLNRLSLLLLMRLLKNTVDGHLAASRGAADSLAQMINVPYERVDVLPNPAIDDRLLALSHEEVSHPWLKDRDIPVLLCVARLVESKGIDTLINAVEIVRRDRAVRLILVGEGAMRTQLEHQVASLGVDEIIDFRGYVDNPFAFMRKADLFVFPSNYEGFGNVLVEALACGCPVVSTDAPSGPREILSDGEFGRIVPIRDPKSLSNAIIAALEESVDKMRLVGRGKAFHVKEVTQTLLSLLKDKK